MSFINNIKHCESINILKYTIKILIVTGCQTGGLRQGKLFSVNIREMYDFQITRFITT